MPHEPDESLAQQVGKLRDDLRINDALSRAMDEARAVVETILFSEDLAGAQGALRERFGFDEVQALAVLD
jgi:DNA gyrase/topoisomerase IV subunit A